MLCLALAAQAEGVQAVAGNPADALLNAPLVVSDKQFVKAPAGAGTVAALARVATLTVNGLTLRVALDADTAAAKRFSSVRFDFTGAGTFDAAQVAKLRSLAGVVDGALVFGPQTCTVALNGRTTPVTISGSYRQKQLTLYLSTALQGECAFGTKTHAVRLVDGDNNLQPGTVFLLCSAPIDPQHFTAGDTLVVDVGDGSFNKTVRAFYGQPVLVEGNWYTVALAADQSAFTATPFAGATAAIEANRERWSGIFIGKKYLLQLTGMQGWLNVPVDDYRVYLFPDSSVANAKGLPGLLNAQRIQGNGRLITVKSKAMTTLIPKSFVTERVEMAVNGSTVDFALQIDGSTGPDEVPFEVVDANGNIVFHDSFEHG